MKKGQQFKVNSVEELIEAYEYFKDDWGYDSLESEINYYNPKHELNYIQRDKMSGKILLFFKNNDYETIQNPLKYQNKDFLERIEALEKQIAIINQPSQAEAKEPKKLFFTEFERLQEMTNKITMETNALNNKIEELKDEIKDELKKIN